VLLAAGTLRAEANTGSPVRQTDPSRIPDAPSASTHTTKRNPVVVIGVDRGGVGCDNGATGDFHPREVEIRIMLEMDTSGSLTG
jgi:hypothetical protein